jgi:glycosyltransferase involved in cell wall biosynthesis
MSDSSRLISVIIPCFNQARFLAEAIESVLNQTYPQTQIVVVDDGSTDATREVASRYPNVRFLRQRNRGPAAARNSGARESTGSYLVFLDADDRLLPHALAVGMRYLAAHPESAFVSGHCRYIAEDGSLMSIPKQPLVEHDHYRELLYRNYVWAGSTVLFRRRCFEAAGPYRTGSSIQGAEDYDLYLRIARRFNVFCHGEVVSDYRQYHPSAGNVSHQAGGVLRGTLTALRDQWPHIKGNRDYELQYRRGVEHKKVLWGGLVLRELNSGRQGTIGGMLLLLRYNPPLLLKFIGQHLSRSIFHS